MSPYRLRMIVALAAGAMLVACGGSSEGSDPGTAPTLIVDTEHVARGVTYCERDGVDLKMDIYFPGETPDRSPAVLYLHGGAWVFGNRAAAGGVVDFGEILSRGYVVASIDYSLAPKYAFPAQIEDAKCAVRFLRSQAHYYRIDPDQIAALGASSGGHLAALLGVTDEDAGFEGEGHDGVSSAVQAVVDLFGPTDLTSPDYVWNADDVNQSVFGSTVRERREASPVTYVSEDDAPFMIIHGVEDGVIPMNQSEALMWKLQAVGVPVRFVPVENAEHGLAPTGDGIVWPSQSVMIEMIGDFLDGVFGRRTVNSE